MRGSFLRRFSLSTCHVVFLLSFRLREKLKEILKKPNVIYFDKEQTFLDHFTVHNFGNKAKREKNAEREFWEKSTEKREKRNFKGKFFHRNLNFSRIHPALNFYSPTFFSSDDNEGGQGGLLTQFLLLFLLLLIDQIKLIKN